MKRYLLFAGLFLINLLHIQSQNIVLNYEGQQLTNDETVAIIGDTSLFDMAIELDVTNNTSATMEISCQRYEVDTIAHSALYMCWANCTVLPFGGTVTLEPGETAELFGAHCNPNGNFGVERSLYTFYNENNPADSISFLAVFSTTSVMIEDEEENAMFFESKEFWGVPNDEISYQIPGIRNISNNPIPIIVEQQIIEWIDGAEISFEWGGILYENENTSESVILAELESNASFIAHYHSPSELGISRVSYTFYEENNIENKQKIEFIFNTTAVGINTIISSISHQSFPNPSHGQLYIRYQMDSNIANTTLEIINLQSQVIYQQQINDLVGNISISLPVGNYFYRFISPSASTSAVKFIII
ncbi:MAG: T9SS type A sorting domain-containing protein [Bacteroidales bacterium]|nr:T9SS type A sorting domain-containing protein [Bacteroidales bacterium]